MNALVLVNFTAKIGIDKYYFFREDIITILSNEAFLEKYLLVLIRDMYTLHSYINPYTTIYKFYFFQ